MKNYRDIITFILWHFIPAVAVTALGWWLLASAGGGWLAIPRLLFGMACLIAAGVIMALPIARLIAEPCGSLFWPDRHYNSAQPVYSIPQSLRKKGLPEKAIMEYEKIAEEYPGEVKPYIEMIDIAIVELKNPGKAEEIYGRGISLLKNDEDKEMLTRMYEAMRSQLNANPNTQYRQTLLERISRPRKD